MPFNIDDPGSLERFFTRFARAESLAEYKKAMNPEAALNEVKTSSPLTESENTQLSDALPDAAAGPSAVEDGIKQPAIARHAIEPQRDGSDLLRELASRSKLTLKDSIHATSPADLSSQCLESTSAAEYCPMLGAQLTAPVKKEDIKQGRTMLNERNLSALGKSFRHYEGMTFSDIYRFASFYPPKSVMDGLALNASPLEASSATPPATVAMIAELGVEAIDGELESSDLARAIELPASDATSAALDSQEPKKIDSSTEPRRAVVSDIWIVPTARGEPDPQIRSVILIGFPPSVDFTIVQSLIHGGAIDNMGVNPQAGTAFVKFTTGKACEAFVGHYPDGMNVKVNGKKCTVLVEKGVSVDPIYGVQRGHLEAGATRVLRVENIDREWSMRALQKVAEGAVTRRVEKIVDSYDGKNRNVAFRFASIFEAVHFRVQLLRDEDWNGVRVQFEIDPCVEATGRHFD